MKIFKSLITNIINDSRYYSIKLAIDLALLHPMLKQKHDKYSKSFLVFLLMSSTAVSSMFFDINRGPIAYRKFITNLGTSKSNTQLVLDANTKKSVCKMIHSDCDSTFKNCFINTLATTKKNFLQLAKLYGKLYAVQLITAIFIKKTITPKLITDYITSVAISTATLGSGVFIIMSFLNIIDQTPYLTNETRLNTICFLSFLPFYFEKTNRLKMICHLMMTLYIENMVHDFTTKNDVIWKRILVVLFVIHLYKSSQGNIKNSYKTLLCMI